jgi:hypothetical protein
MQSTSASGQWKQWFHPSRLVPLLTVLGAGIAIVLSFLNLIQLSLSEEIIIALLALLAVDALSERLSFLERVQTNLSNLSTQIQELPLADIKLEDRSTFTGTLDKPLRDAHRLDIFGLTLRGVIAHSWGCFEKMAANPYNRLRFLIVKPGSAAVDSAIGFTQEKEQREQEIESSKRILTNLAKRDNVSARFTSVAPPFSLLITDPGEAGGKTQVELYGRGTAPNERPHFILARDNQPWYDFFTQQFEILWGEAQTLEEIEGELK